MRRQHIEIGNEETLEGAAETRMHKRSMQKKALIVADQAP